MILGAHVSTAGGLHNAIKNGDKLHCDTIQIFLRNPNRWVAKPPTPEVIEKFREAWATSPIGEVIVHDIHLSNLASPKTEVLENHVSSFKSKWNLRIHSVSATS